MNLKKLYISEKKNQINLLYQTSETRHMFVIKNKNVNICESGFFHVSVNFNLKSQ